MKLGNDILFEFGEWRIKRIDKLNYVVEELLKTPEKVNKVKTGKMVDQWVFFWYYSSFRNALVGIRKDLTLNRSTEPSLECGKLETLIELYDTKIDSELPQTIDRLQVQLIKLTEENKKLKRKLKEKQ